VLSARPESTGGAVVSEEPEKKARILIIDDELIILDLTSIILRNRGYEIHTAKDAAVGIALVGSVKPDLVMLDYMMPGMDGLSALKEIRRDFPDSYVIMFTGKGNEEIAVDLMKAGASDYILKPFNNQDLVERIENVLRIRTMEIHNRELLGERERLLEEIATWNQELERRVEEKTSALQKFQAEFVQSEKLAALGYLSAGMAHEIRNPLNSISLFVQLLKGWMDDPEKIEYCEKIFKEIDRIDGILGKLLHASKRPMSAPVSVNLDQVITEVLELFSPQTELNNIAVELDFRRIPPPIKADRTEIEHIFTNLFLNAIHEMVGDGKLTIQLDHDDRDISVRISDTGKGIPKEALSGIFDPFFTTKKSGTGMGLAVVRRIVNTCKGKIEVERSDGTGTTFRVTLPLSTS
jgi:signal transduction histidine kinase